MDAHERTAIILAFEIPSEQAKYMSKGDVMALHERIDKGESYIDPEDLRPALRFARLKLVSLEDMQTLANRDELDRHRRHLIEQNKLITKLRRESHNRPGSDVLSANMEAKFKELQAKAAAHDYVLKLTKAKSLAGLAKRYKELVDTLRILKKDLKAVHETVKTFRKQNEAPAKWEIKPGADATAIAVFEENSGVMAVVNNDNAARKKKDLHPMMVRTDGGLFQVFTEEQIRSMFG